MDSSFALALVLVALVALGGLVLLAKRRQRASTTVDVRLIARVPLDATHQLFVVEAEGRRLLLGAHGSGLQLVTELTPRAGVAAVIPLRSAS